MLQYIPFWSIPILMICLQFSYIYWLKMRRTTAMIFVMIGGFSFVCLLYYFWAGSPIRSAQLIKEIINEI